MAVRGISAGSVESWRPCAAMATGRSVSRNTTAARAGQRNPLAETQTRAAAKRTAATPRSLLRREESEIVPLESGARAGALAPALAGVSVLQRVDPSHERQPSKTRRLCP